MTTKVSQKNKEDWEPKSDIEYYGKPKQPKTVVIFLGKGLDKIWHDVYKYQGEYDMLENVLDLWIEHDGIFFIIRENFGTVLC